MDKGCWYSPVRRRRTYEELGRKGSRLEIRQMVGQGKVICLRHCRRCFLSSSLLLLLLLLFNPPLSLGYLRNYMLLLLVGLCCQLELSFPWMILLLQSKGLGVLIAKAFGMSPMFYAGFILTSCVARAQLSSYASFLSKGDVAVSILLTSFTTIASVLLTPLLTGLLIGSVVPVDAVMMSKSILQVVLVPVALGLVLNTYAKPIVTILRPVMPFVAMICTSLCIGSPLALNQSQILSKDGLQLVLPVLAFHAVAFAMGYWILKIPAFRQREEVC
ncbi:probable sodium/metabolite cotransporter BASS3, chloroplastic isoform X2 [Gossypium hirsutum]|uniref:Probable sodium/metabolite cotransporter BASS3, chloroplastic isoform X2 n=1 Tax=Gossypium hirsutum TaxID=3635 RepID=A0ABM3ALH3_GOSHI|nr:probable sodium/metabolite cotransporter BASS3, chloroplastic isoform X2 [Gossypium hirsutum]